MRYAAFGLAVLALLASGAATAHAETRVHGRVRFDLPGMQLADLGPVVVYIADSGGTADAPAASMQRAASVHQKDARFAPAFLAIAAGQDVAMPNDDQIYHNVFSYSRPNEFDLGLYPAGESRKVALRHPGVVKLYCSIHESMNGTIFVAPTRWFATAAADGSFALEGVPPGRHRVRTWNEKLPDTEHVVEVAAGGDVAVELSLLPR
jgi:plastocyanin